MASATSIDVELQARLASVLPKGHRFQIHHLSTPPFKTDALCSAPPGQRPDRTYCEKHFLTVSIDPPNLERAGSVLVLALEIFIYSTAYSTTLFVSKADSTGYLDLLSIPKGTPSLIRGVCSTFINHLVEKRKRNGRQFVVSLFARAQDQYLFPGSVKYRGKHVLDDRGLVRWWCRVLEDLFQKPKNAEAFLIVPGLDDYEMKGMLPRASAGSWALGHPLERISHYSREMERVPPRCLLPRFPDDPVTRYRDELDEEVAGSKQMKTNGMWKTVKTLDTFWEMMAFRQECSSGRMTGFIWVVFEDSGLGQEGVPEAAEANNLAKIRALMKGDRSNKKKKKKSKSKLRGIIKPRQPKVKMEKGGSSLLKLPVSSPYYFWPREGRGVRVVDEAEFKKCVDLLLHQDFANLDKALTSTSRWIRDVGMGWAWGFEVMGTAEPKREGASLGDGGPPAVNNLSGMIKRKRTDSGQQGQVNVLTAGLVRKKPKEDEAPQPVAAPGVNVLGSSVVRKKPKD